MLKKIMKGMRKFTVQDYAMYELSVFFGTMVVVKIRPGITDLGLSWYLLGFIITGGYVLHKLGNK